MERVILHSDLNNCYASIECLYRPELREKPVAVCGDPEMRHGIVLAKNYIAKAYGIKTGEAMWEAKQKCPEIVFVPADFDKYIRFSRMANEIYADYTNEVQRFGIDESWLDVSDSARLFGDGKKIADDIRRRIKFELGVTASVGVSFNRVFAKLASEMKKPDATTAVSAGEYKEKIWPLPAEDLLCVGRSTRRKLSMWGIYTIGDLACADLRFLFDRLGKNGSTLWSFANGRDHSPVMDVDEAPPIKSVGNSWTTPYDLVDDNSVKITLYLLCESVSARLREYGYRGNTVQLTIRDKDLFSYQRQSKVEMPIYSTLEIFEKAYELFNINHRGCKPVRSLAVCVYGLTDANTMQTSLFAGADLERHERIDGTIDDLRRRFGHFIIQRGIMLTEPQLSQVNPKAEHVIHPYSFLA